MTDLCRSWWQLISEQAWQAISTEGGTQFHGTADCALQKKLDSGAAVVQGHSPLLPSPGLALCRNTAGAQRVGTETIRIIRMLLPSGHHSLQAHCIPSSLYDREHNHNMTIQASLNEPPRNDWFPLQTRTILDYINISTCVRQKKNWKTKFPDTKHRSNTFYSEIMFFQIGGGENLIFIKRVWLFVGWFNDLAKEGVENSVWALFIPDFIIPWNPKNKDW